MGTAPTDTVKHGVAPDLAKETARQTARPIHRVEECRCIVDAPAGVHLTASGCPVHDDLGRELARLREENERLRRVVEAADQMRDEFLADMELRKTADAYDAARKELDS